MFIAMGATSTATAEVVSPGFSKDSDDVRARFPPQDTHLIKIRIHDLMWSKAFSIVHPLKNVSGSWGARALDLQLFARRGGFPQSTVPG